MTSQTVRLLRFWQAEREALQIEMRRNPKVILLGEDIVGAAGRESQGIIEGWGGPYGTTRGLVQEFGRARVVDTPISEAGFLGAAAGLAESGYRPWVEIMFPSFLAVCLDQLITNIAQKYHLYGRQRSVPVVVKTLINNHGVLYALAAHIPGLKVVAPSDPFTVKGLTLAALRDEDPVVIFDNISLLRNEGPVPEGDYVLPLGKARVVRDGSDVTLVGISAMTGICLQAADALAQDGVSAEVVDLLSLAPIDEATILASVSKTGRLVVVDEGFPQCSPAHDVIALVAQRALSQLVAAPLAVTPPHAFRPFSGPLNAAYAPTSQSVQVAVHEVVGSRSAPLVSATR
jgi:pyruvate/2-oxoglutarate/acetoin dehydrogenase E1 component